MSTLGRSSRPLTQSLLPKKEKDLRAYIKHCAAEGLVEWSMGISETLNHQDIIFDFSFKFYRTYPAIYLSRLPEPNRCGRPFVWVGLATLCLQNICHLQFIRSPRLTHLDIDGLKRWHNCSPGGLARPAYMPQGHKCKRDEIKGSSIISSSTTQDPPLPSKEFLMP